MRHCPYCKKHTEHKLTQNKAKGRSSAHPMSRGAKVRVMKRGDRRGYGNLGRYSKPSKPKMSGKKTSKKSDFRYKCSACNKTHTQKKGFRAKKLEFV